MTRYKYTNSIIKKYLWYDGHHHRKWAWQQEFKSPKYTNTLSKGMTPTILSPAMDRYGRLGSLTLVWQPV